MQVMRATFMALIIAAPFLFACDRSGPPVHFMLPQNFRGAFRLTIDKSTRGTEVTKSNGEVIVTVPTNGLVFLKNADFLFHWHSEIASYPDGTLFSSENAMTNDVILFSLENGQDVFSWILGTESEYKIANRLHFEKLPLARKLSDADLPSDERTNRQTGTNR